MDFQHALSLSPLTPKAPKPSVYEFANSFHLTPLPTKRQQTGPFRFTEEELDTKDLAHWSPEKVAQWMLDAGVELTSAERFVENDITGAILITLKFEDLKELGIPSFGVRTRMWEEIQLMKEIRPQSPRPETEIESEPDREVRRELRRQGSVGGSKRRPSKSKPRPKINDVISPLESVSIVGIEQMMPKLHSCSKGKNCAKWKRNQRMIEAFKQDHPFVSLEEGLIMVAGDPGNPTTADALNTEEDVFRPVSDAIPSVVASSDILGPGPLPSLQFLEEAVLRSIQSRDPQDNVRQFLQFQQLDLATSSEVPPTPPFEVFPPTPKTLTPSSQLSAQQRRRTLPKLEIPAEALPAPRRQPASAHPIPYREIESASDEAEDDLTTPTAPYRFGTPFSEMDVPVTAVNLGPVARDASQSVPPDMTFRPQITRTASRATSRRPSFPVLPALDENNIVTPATHRSTKSFAQRIGNQQRAPQPPPRVQYPWSPMDRPAYEIAIAPVSGVTGFFNPTSVSPTADKTSDMTDGSTISYQGLMKKRKTKMLRHEWHEHYFTLRGTSLNMHKDARSANKTLEYIDVDDYAIACSGAASTSKLNSAFKAMHIRRDTGSSGKNDVGAFSFQLIPQDQKGGVRLRKRESTVPGGGAAPSSAAAGPGLEGAVNGTGKTHHFAVNGRDERIDWMRELMLAKALKQKGEGAQVTVNGNMI